MASLGGNAMVMTVAPATAVAASAVHKPGRRELLSGWIMAKNLPCYSRDASVLAAVSACGFTVGALLTAAPRAT
jgi:hypothetical protein